MYFLLDTIYHRYLAFDFYVANFSTCLPAFIPLQLLLPIFICDLFYASKICLPVVRSVPHGTPIQIHVKWDTAPKRKQQQGDRGDSSKVTKDKHKITKHQQHCEQRKFVIRGRARRVLVFAATRFGP